MKKFLVAIIFCFFLLPTTINAKSINYINQQYNYSFTVPSGWVEIPKSTIDEVMQQFADITGGQVIDYITGFQLENTEIFQHPYILVQQHEINTPSYNKINQILKSDKVFETVNKEINKYSELMTNIDFQEPFIDREKNIIFLNMETNVIGVGEVKGLMAMFLGKNGITQLNFISVKSEYSENLSTFSQVIDSFKYKQGYEYNKEEAKKNDSPSVFKGAIEKGVGGFIAGGFFALVFGLFSILTKKEKK